MANVFGDIPDRLPEELVETLLKNPFLKLERIVSRGHATAPGQWYDQTEDEWVLLLKGAAQLRLEDRTDPVILKPGDYIRLPAHCRHRVEWTDPENDTVWLALHYSNGGETHHCDTGIPAG